MKNVVKATETENDKDQVRSQAKVSEEIITERQICEKNKMKRKNWFA